MSICPQAIKLKFGLNKIGKRQSTIFRPENVFITKYATDIQNKCINQKVSPMYVSMS